MTRQSLRFRAMHILATLVLAAGCSENSTTPVKISSVELNPAAATVQVGDTVRLAATPVRNGVGLTNYPVAWSSSNDGVAKVSSTGLVTAVAAGEATIRATAEGVSGSAKVTVNLPPVAALELQPGSATVESTDTLRLRAVLRDANGTVLEGRTITWSSSDTSIVSVSSGGMLTGVAAGQAEITAISEGVRGTAAITVVPRSVRSVEVRPSEATMEAGDTLRFTAILRAADGTVLEGRPVTWSSSRSGDVAVDAGGLVKATNPSTAYIRATANGVVDSARVTVILRRVATVEVTPRPASVKVGDTLRFTAIPRAADGTRLYDREIRWSSTNTAVATVSADGLVRGVSQGTASVVATSGEGSGSAQITVQPADSVWRSMGSWIQGPPVTQLLNFNQELLAVQGGVHRWDGTSWQRLGGTDSPATGADVVVHDGGLLLADNARGVFRWNGSSWAQVAPLTQFSGDVTSLTVHRDTLVAAVVVGPSNTTEIYKWTGFEWLQIGMAFNGRVNALEEYGGQLYAGGAFTRIGTREVGGLVRWNGGSWEVPGGVQRNEVKTLAVYRGELIAAGLQRPVAWNGTSWRNLEGGDLEHTVSRLQVVGSDLIVVSSGSSSAGRVPYRVTAWNGTAWRAIGSGSVSLASGERILAATLFQGVPVLGGSFTQIDGRAIRYTARWGLP